MGRNIRVTVLFTVLIVATVILGAWLIQSLPGRHQPADIPLRLQDALLPEPRPMTAFSLSDQRGRAFDLERLKGKWTFMFFGYTSCPDICPTTMLVMREIASVLARDPRDIDSQFVFVSVDPQRDNPENLGRYVEYFNPHFVGATGDSAQLEVLTRQLNVMAMRIEESPSTNYLISHTSSIMLIDPKARLYAAFSPPHDRTSIIERFYIIHNYYKEGNQ